MRGQEFEGLGDVFAELAQMATASTHGGGRMDDAFARKVRWQRPARGLLSWCGFRIGDGGRRLHFGSRCHQIGELQLHLIDQLSPALGGCAEPIMTQFCDGELEVCDLGVQVEPASLGLCGALFSLLGPPNGG